MERQTGIRPAALDGPSFPEPLGYLWAWFFDLHNGRSLTGFGPTSATHLDLMAWQWNAGIRCEPWEIRVLMALGNTWVKAMSDTKPAGGTSTAPPPPMMGKGRR